MSDTEDTQAAGKTYYTDSASGADGHDGLSRSKAFKTIQRGCDRLKPGDTLCVARGVYYEHVVLTTAGTAEAPITIKAEAAGRGDVLITGADPDIRERLRRWGCEDAEIGLYAISFPFEPHRIHYGDIDLCPYPGLEQLKAFHMEPNWPGPQHGFWYDAEAKILHVRLHASGRYGPTDPNLQTMNVGGPPGEGPKRNLPTEPRHFLIGVVSDGPAHVVIDGFTFQCPGTSAIFAGADHILIRNCWFLGCLAAVSGRGSYDGKPRRGNHVRVFNCDYSEPDLWGELGEAIRTWGAKPDIKPYYWWARKEKYERGMVSEANDDWEVAFCYLHDCFEALSFMAFGRGSSNGHVHHCVFCRSIDNHIEFEYEMTNFVMHDNLFVDAFRHISYQAFERRPGPIWFFRNVIVSSDAMLDLFQKAGHDGGSWNKFPINHPIPLPGLLIYNNTIVSRNTSAKSFHENLHLFNNVFWVSRCKERERHAQIDGNIVYAQEPANAEWLAGEHGCVVGSAEELGVIVEGDFGDWRSLRLRLSATSPALHGSIRPPFPLTGLTDPRLGVCGAFAAGDVWTPPTVGPIG